MNTCLLLAREDKHRSTCLKVSYRVRLPTCTLEWATLTMKCRFLAQLCHYSDKILARKRFISGILSYDHIYLSDNSTFPNG